MTDQVAIRRGGSDDQLAVVRLFDAAMLDTDADRRRRQLRGRDGGMLIATRKKTVVGAIALDTATGSDRHQRDADGNRLDSDTDPVQITAIAVRRQRRDHGIGRALVERAGKDAAPRPLTAVFDERVRPFYTACGFEIEPHDGRYWGIRWPKTAMASGTTQ